MSPLWDSKVGRVAADPVSAGRVSGGCVSATPFSFFASSSTGAAGLSGVRGSSGIAGGIPDPGRGDTGVLLISWSSLVTSIGAGGAGRT